MPRVSRAPTTSPRLSSRPRISLAALSASNKSRAQRIGLLFFEGAWGNHNVRKRGFDSLTCAVSASAASRSGYNAIAAWPRGNSGRHRAGRSFILALSIQDTKMEFLVNMKAPTHDHDHQAVPPDLSLRVKSLESLLVEKGLVDPAALDELIDTYENKVGPRNGARVVARAWVDPAYKQRLLTEATAAIAEFGYAGRGGEHMVVVENTPKLHNLIVCTGIPLGRNG